MDIYGNAIPRSLVRSRLEGTFFPVSWARTIKGGMLFDNHSVGNSIVHAKMEIHAIHQAELLDITLLVCRLLKSHPATPAAGVV